MYYFTTLTRFLQKLQANYNQTVNIREQAMMFPDSAPTQDRLKTALEQMKDEDQQAATYYAREVVEDIVMLRRNNANRIVSEPENGDLNLLSALQLIRHIPDELALAARRNLSGSRVCQLALKNVVLNSWADDGTYKLPAALDDANWPMPQRDAEKIIKKIEEYCDRLRDPDIARQEKIYDDEQQFLRNVIGLNDRDIGRFRFVTSSEAKY